MLVIFNCVYVTYIDFYINPYFTLTDQIIPDRIIRVSVKASALTCLISILDLYPEILTIYLGIQSDNSHHNLSGEYKYTDYLLYITFLINR